MHTLGQTHGPNVVVVISSHILLSCAVFGSLGIRASENAETRNLDDGMEHWQVGHDVKMAPVPNK